jgi:hypothetical protein
MQDAVFSDGYDLLQLMIAGGELEKVSVDRS